MDLWWQVWRIEILLQWQLTNYTAQVDNSKTLARETETERLRAHPSVFNGVIASEAAPILQHAQRTITIAVRSTQQHE